MVRRVLSSFVASMSLLGVLALVALLTLTTATALAVECPNEQLRVEDNSTALPECRAYEQVTPAGPYDSDFGAVSPDGNTVFFGSSGAIDGLPSDDNNGLFNSRMFGVSRLASGWSLSSFTNFLGEVEQTYGFLGASQDGSRMYITTPEEPVNLYETGADGSSLLVSREQDGNPSSDLVGPVVVSADGGDVVFSSASPLTEVAARTGGGPYVYEAETAGNVSLVSVMSDGELPVGGAGAGIGSTQPGELLTASVVTNAVSADGATVFFTSSGEYDPSAADTGPQVFMHRDGATIDVSKSQTGIPGTSGATFDDASSTGDQVVFSDPDQLTADAPSSGSSQIYEYNSQTDNLSLISKGDDEDLNDSEDGATFLTMSGDGSHVFFASRDQLDPAGPPKTDNETFLYEWVSGHVTYITTLSDVGEGDLERLESRTEARLGEPGRVAGAAASLGPIRTTPNGDHLVFESERRLTPDDRNEEAGRLNVYEYTDGEGLIRVSQGSLPGSGNGPYDATIGSQGQSPDFAPGQEGYPFTYGPSQNDGRVLTEDGGVFFSSREALAEGATNGPLHVYEWREGKTYLISPAGPNATDARYLENSSNGTDVYFSTTQQVLPSDTNGGWVNIWDARVGGGYPHTTVANACPDNECTIASPTARGAPISSLFAGSGNPVPSASLTTSAPASKPEPKSPTRTEMLSAVVKACQIKEHNKHKRAACERRARKRYGAKAKKSTQDKGRK
jgi:hypothetical protein